MLCLCAAIEAHDEIVAGVVFDLMKAKRLGEEEGAPVCETTNNALSSEYD